MDGDLFLPGDRRACQDAYWAWLNEIAAQPEGDGGPAKMRRNGRLGGVKRGVRNRQIIAFCKSIVFKDISLNTMKFAMRELFGVAVAHEDLMAWATPGRKADDRVDKDAVLAVLDAGDVRANAGALMARIDGQWAAVKTEAYAAARRERSEAGAGAKAAKPAKAKRARGKPGTGKQVADLFEDISLNR